MHKSEESPARHALDMDALPYAVGAILLGLVTIVVRDFALQWQPVPQVVPGRPALAIISGLILIIGGITAVWRNAGNYRLILPIFYALWVLILHVPNSALNPNLGSLLGVAEILCLAVAGYALAQTEPRASLNLVARLLYGICPLIFGLCHFVYADFTASMVPGWIPAKLFWAYFTGAAHLAAGAAILSGIWARLAATMLAVMCGAFVLLLHLPRVVQSPRDRMEWTMTGIALAIAGGAWLIRRRLPAVRAPAVSPDHA